jgi:flagellar biosynthesis anti-sigma factor FlgM
MIIDRVGSLATEVLTDKGASGVGRGAAAGVSQEESAHTTLTSDTVAVKSLVARAMETAPVRQDKVNSLRESVANGTYSLNSRETASAFLNDLAG